MHTSSSPLISCLESHCSGIRSNMAPETRGLVDNDPPALIPRELRRQRSWSLMKTVHDPRHCEAALGTVPWQHDAAQPVTALSQGLYGTERGRQHHQHVGLTSIVQRRRADAEAPCPWRHSHSAGPQRSCDHCRAVASTGRPCNGASMGTSTTALDQHFISLKASVGHHGTNN